MIPPPAVIHWMSPGPMVPLLPMLSPWSTSPVEHVGDRLDAAVRVPGEPRQVPLGVGVAEIVQQEERVQLRHLLVAEGPRRCTPAPSRVGRLFQTFAILRAAMCFPSKTCSAAGAHGTPDASRLRDSSGDHVVYRVRGRRASMVIPLKRD